MQIIRSVPGVSAANPLLMKRVLRHVRFTRAERLERPANNHHEESKRVFDAEYRVQGRLQMI